MQRTARNRTKRNNCETNRPGNTNTGRNAPTDRCRTRRHPRARWAARDNLQTPPQHARLCECGPGPHPCFARFVYSQSPIFCCLAKNIFPGTPSLALPSSSPHPRKNLFICGNSKASYKFVSPESAKWQNTWFEDITGKYSWVHSPPRNLFVCSRNSTKCSVRPQPNTKVRPLPATNIRNAPILTTCASAMNIPFRIGF